MSRPSDHFDAGKDGFEARDRDPKKPASGGARATMPSKSGGPAKPGRASALVAWLRTAWRQLTSMRTALLLLLLLAIAAIPGSLVPQRSSDPNGVIVYQDTYPDIAPFLDDIGMFDVYSSPWFTAIYLLLFVSLIGCIIPRIKHHWDALRSKPPKTPARLSRLDAYSTQVLGASLGPKRGAVIDEAAKILRDKKYRTVIFDDGKRGVSVSAERGYMRETGNLVFHSAMVGVIVAVGIGGGFTWSGQRVLVEGQTFVNGLVSYSSFNPGRFFTPDVLAPFSMRLDSFDITYEEENQNAIGQATDYAANVTVNTPGGEPQTETVRVNDPLRFAGTDSYLLGNGYAPEITVRDPQGNAVFSDFVPFLPQDSFLTSMGVVKVPDGLDEQIGMLGFFYPSAVELESGALTSNHPDLRDPMLTLNVYSGDLGLDEGVPRSVYTLDTDTLTPIAARDLDFKPIELRPGETAELPNGLGTIELGEVPRYASFDVHEDPTQIPVLIFAVLIIAGLFTSLLVPRRRLWVKATTRADGTVLVEYAGLARGDDPQLAAAVNDLLDVHTRKIVGLAEPASPARDSGGAKRPEPTSGSGSGADRQGASLASSPTQEAP